MGRLLGWKAERSKDHRGEIRLNTLADGQAPRILIVNACRKALLCLNTLADGQAPRIINVAVVTEDENGLNTLADGQAPRIFAPLG